MHNARLSILKSFFILFFLGIAKSAWSFRTNISSVTPVRSVTRCAEPAAIGFIPRQTFMSYGNKTAVRLFALVWAP
jgi:hypothetical protein